MKRTARCLGRWALLVSMALGAVASQAQTQVDINISVPGASIGIHTPRYPGFVRVASYPVYYAPRQAANLFFYEGLYWVYQHDTWYSSAWFDGPWYEVGSQRVPQYVLRIPVRYYRDPPGYFRGLPLDEPPRWGEHWGNDWQQRRSGWDRWDRSAMPAPAPLPKYQRGYSGKRYPKAEAQQALRDRNYRYQPRDEVVREHLQRQARHAGDDNHKQGRPEAKGASRPVQPGQRNGQIKAKGRDKDDDDGKKSKD